MLSRVGLATALATASVVMEGLSIAEIQGSSWLSPYNGTSVRNVTGIVTAKGPSGVWIQDGVSTDSRVSSSLYVFGSAIVNKTAIGDKITLNGKISEYRSDPSYLYSTELTSPSSIVVLSSNNTVQPIVLGQDRSPPIRSLSALDTAAGPDGWLSVPNNQSQISTTNATLLPDQHGLDFWASLEGMLVTVRNPIAIDFENQYGEFWIRGDWPASGVNQRGGLTLTVGPDGIPDANPEAILLDNPLDKTKNPTTTIGMTLSDITGVVQYQFGFYYLEPLTAPTVLSRPDYNPPASPYTPSTDPCSVIIGDYNVENMSPKVAHLPVVASHIVNYLKTPDIMFLQEIQDDNGEGDDGTVSSNLTLSTLVNAITAAGASFNYSYTYVLPVDGQDGGVPGGNIRPAYLYNPAKVTLVPGSPVGGPLDANQVTTDASGNVGLKFNPGRIDPTNAAWDSSRKPIVANWQTVSGERFFTIDVHYASKGGSSSSQGDARPPVNGVVAGRTSQVSVTADFVKSILAADSDASVVVAGDMNEYTQTRSVFAGFQGLLQDLDEVAGIAPEERYTYVFDQNTQELDHLFVSSAIAARNPTLEHIHVNTWSPSYKVRTSDHDPSVAQIKVCTNLQKHAGAYGGISAPAVTKKGNKYYVKGKPYLLLPAARTVSCNLQLAACSALANTQAFKPLDCVAQEAKCLLKVLA